MHTRIAGRLTGRVTTWFVVAFWIVAAALSGAFGASKLRSVQNNESSAYLPGNAESTKVMDALTKVRNPDQIPVVLA